MQKLRSLYGWNYAKAVVGLLESNDYAIGKYLFAYWHTSDFSVKTFGPSRMGLFLLWMMRLGLYTQYAVGIWLGVYGVTHHFDGWWAYGLAVLLAAPIIWAHAVVIILWIQYLTHPKKLGRLIICAVLERQVVRLRKRHQFTVVAVVGSVGKTSTKASIARVLSASKRVLWQQGNYNDRVTVPLIFFDQPLPNLLNLPAWIMIWMQNERIIRSEFPYDAVVVELGVDGPGQMKDFTYVHPEITVVTAITPEHMEYFGTVDAVAKEELSALRFSKKALINVDDTPEQYLKRRKFVSYGFGDGPEYSIEKRTSKGLDGQKVTLRLGSKTLAVSIPMPGLQGAKIALAAAAVAHLLGESHDAIAQGLAQVEAFAGRMRLFEGIKGSTLIDDTYNASPIAAIAALDVLYETKAAQRIAILGSMNELGDYSPEAHREVADHCNAKKLDLVVTIGHDANTYLAPIAAEMGCNVHTFMSPYAAGKYVKKQLKKSAVVLAKGSQNGVFAEEALKQLLVNKEDASQMVRQSVSWLSIKRQQFDDAPKEDENEEA